MRLKELRRTIAILSALDDETPVNINFSGYLMENTNIGSIQITGDTGNESVNITIQGNPYCSELKQDIVEIELGSLKDKEKTDIKKALEECNGNCEEAAKVLGISRRTIYRKIKQYGLKEVILNNG